MVSGLMRPGSSNDCGRAMSTSPETELTRLLHSFTKAALKHAEKIENGKFFNMAAVYRLHIVGGDIPGGEHTVKRAVVVDDGHGGDLPSRMVRHARSIVTEQFSSGGRSKSRSHTCVRILLCTRAAQTRNGRAYAASRRLSRRCARPLYSLSPRALRRRAYAIEATMESVSGIAVSGDVYFIHLPYLLPYGVLEQCTMIILESTAEFKLICAIFTNL